MVLKNLFTGLQWRNNIENRRMDVDRGEERLRCMERVKWKHITICKIANGNLLYDSGEIMGSGTSRGVGWRGRWEGVSNGRGYMYTYG